MPKNPETAITVVEQDATAVVEQDATAVVEWNLDGFPEGEYNRLIPTQTIAMPTDLFRPVVQVVRLSTNPDDGDVYHSSDMKAGYSAPTRVALRKLATAAGVSIVDERRTDDGSDPNVCEVTVWAEMPLPTGQRLRAMGVKRIDLRAQKWSEQNPETHKAKFRAFFQEHVASRAENRAIRALLSLRGSYPNSELAKPFAVVSIAPNMNHPEVRARVLDSMGPAIAQVYGPAPAKQLGSGLLEVAPAPDDDEPAAPTTLPGEKLAKAAVVDEDEQPAWIAGEKATPLVELLRGSAEASNLAGEPTGPQREAMGLAFGDMPNREINAGLRVAFGWDREARPLTAAQAQAVIAAAESRRDTFLDEWRQMVADAKAAA